MFVSPLGLNAQDIRNWSKDHQTSVTAWCALTGFVLFVFIFLSDRDFSFLLTLSSLISCFCFGMVAWKIHNNRSYRGISRKMFECYGILQVARILSIVPFSGYLPYDKTGDWLYQCIEMATLAWSALIVYWGRTTYVHTYNEAGDTFKTSFLMIGAAILSVLFHPTLNSNLPTDLCWTFALYLEVCSCLPQLWLFQHERKVEPFTSHFLAGQGIVALLSTLFWSSTYKELNDHGRGKGRSGLWVLVGHFVKLVVLGDFLYIYFQCMRSGVTLDSYYQDKV